MCIVYKMNVVASRVISRPPNSIYREMTFLSPVGLHKTVYFQLEILSDMVDFQLEALW